MQRVSEMNNMFNIASDTINALNVFVLAKLSVTCYEFAYVSKLRSLCKYVNYFSKGADL